MQSEIERLKDENLTLRKNLGDLQAFEEQTLSGLIPVETENTSPHPGPSVWPLWGAGLLAALLLGCLHWILFFKYDTPVVVFRVVTFCVPIALGFLAGSRGRSFWLYEWGIALAVGAVSVSIMLNITHHIDGVPLWPQNLAEWRETLEYALSISLALLTGLLAWGAYARWKQTQRSGATLFLLQRDEKGRLKLEQLTTDVQHLVATVAPVVSGTLAVYSAVKSLLG